VLAPGDVDTEADSRHFRVLWSWSLAVELRHLRARGRNQMKSTDMYFAAFAIVTGHPLRNVTVEAGRVQLWFDDAAAAAALDFESGAAVNARMFSSCHRMLRARAGRELKAAR